MQGGVSVADLCILRQVRLNMYLPARRISGDGATARGVDDGK
jgi:hypothetical protein